MTVDAGGAQIPSEVSQRFRATVPLYAGATSVLYEGTDPSNGQRVLVKVVRESAVSSPAEKQRMLRELQKLAQVRHPALVSIIASGESEGRIWLVRERIEGQSVIERIAQGGPIPAGMAARIAAQVAAALGELHRNGVLHRDLRPGHVLLGLSGQVRVLDAAIARVIRLPDGRLLSGTPGYVAPEAIAGKLVSFRSDLYSLGAVIFEMLHGIAPYGSPDTPGILSHQTERDAPAIRVPAPQALARLVASLLSREPRERPFSAQQLERQLEPLAAGGAETMDDVSDRTIVGDERADEMTTVVPEMSEISRSRAAPPKSDPSEFDDDQPTKVGESMFGRDSAQRAAPPGDTSPSGPIPSGSMPAMTAPPPRGASSSGAMPATPRTGSSAGMAAPPSRSLNAPTAGPPRRATMMGVAPPSSPTGSAPRASSAAAVAPDLAPSPGAQEGSRRIQRPAPDDSENDFDQAMDTVVTEDSRIFGVPEVQGGSPHGSAVPPLPDAVAARVLTGASRQPAAGPPPLSRGPATASSPALSAMSAPPGMPGGAFGPPAPGHAAPPPAANPPVSGGWAAAQGPVGPPTSPPNTWAPNGQASPHGATMPPPAWGPPAAAPTTVGTVPPGFGPPPMYVQSPPAQGIYAQPTAPFQPGYGGQPAGYPPGFVPPPGYAQHAYAQPAPRRSILPWILAGIGVAGIAGAAGYYFASHDRVATPPMTAAPSQPVPIIATPQPTPVPPIRAVPVAPAIPAPVIIPTPAPRPVAANPAPVPIVAPPPVAPAPVLIAPPRAVNPPAPVAVAPLVAPQPAVNPSPPPVAPAPTRSAPRVAAAAPIERRAHDTPTSNTHAGSLAQAHAAFDHHDLAQARSFAMAAVREQPSNAEAHALLADVLSRQNDSAGSLNEWRAASRIAPRNTDYLHRIATLQLDRFDRNGAIATLRQILQINPHDATAQRQLGSLGGGGAAPAGNPAPAPATTARPAASTPASRPSTTTRPSTSHHDDPFVPTFGAPARPVAGNNGRAGSIRR